MKNIKWRIFRHNLALIFAVLIPLLALSVFVLRPAILGHVTKGEAGEVGELSLNIEEAGEYEISLDELPKGAKITSINGGA